MALKVPVLAPFGTLAWPADLSILAAKPKEGVLTPSVVEVAAAIHDWMPPGARPPELGATVPSEALPRRTAAVSVWLRLAAPDAAKLLAVTRSASVPPLMIVAFDGFARPMVDS